MNKDWSNLTEENQIAEIIALSNSIPVYIFKHSTTCGISAQAKENVEISFKNTDKPLKFYYLDLLKASFLHGNSIPGETTLAIEKKVLIKNGL